MAKIRFVGQLTGYRNGVSYPDAGSSEVWEVPDDEARTYVEVLAVARYVEDVEQRATNTKVETRKTSGLTKKSVSRTEKTDSED